MIFNQKENTTIITQEKTTVVELVNKLNDNYNRFKNNNVIIVLNSLNPILKEEFDEFMQLSRKHQKAKHSFVLVIQNVDVNQLSNNLMIVPTLQEAFDLVEMEEIERDLGL